MKVKELIELLERMDPEMNVGLEYPSGDYWNTELVVGIVSVEVKPVAMSVYHRRNQLVEDGEEFDEELVVVSRFQSF